MGHTFWQPAKASGSVTSAHKQRGSRSRSPLKEIASASRSVVPSPEDVIDIVEAPKLGASRSRSPRPLRAVANTHPRTLLEDVIDLEESFDCETVVSDQSLKNST